MKKFTHFTQDDRKIIEKGLDARRSFKEIAVSVGKSPSSVSREVKNHIVRKATGGAGQAFNECANRRDCVKRRVCIGKAPCFKSGARCRACGRCAGVCADFKPFDCPKLRSAPHVCNGCRNLHFCTLRKSFYYAATAEEESRKTLVESRTGITAKEEEIKALDEIFGGGISRGQSISSIHKSKREELPYSSRTIYSYTSKGLFSFSDIDLVKKVKYRQRRKKSDVNVYKVDKQCRLGRTYEDYLKYADEYPDMPLVEMDTVVGSGSKVLLTLHFVESSLMLAFIRDANTSASVAAIFAQLREKLGRDAFAALFPVILTDNGTEFSNPRAIEELSGGKTKIFYCRPNSSWQKGAIENNHRFIRRILPKGSNFDALTQEDISLMMSHINAYVRQKLNFRTPYETFSFCYGEETLLALGIYKTTPEDIILLPELLRK